MPTFAFSIRDADGRPRAGSTEAPDAAAAASALRAGGAVILALAEARTARAERTAPSASMWLKPRSSAIELSLKQMSVMLASGMTLLESLHAAAQQGSSRHLARVWVDVARRVQGGRTLTQAMGAYPWFGRMVLQLVAVGEQTGSLDVVLARAADGLERRRLLRAQVVSALLYPAIVLLASIGVTVFMLTFAVPRITMYLEAFGRPLPPMTQGLVDMSAFLTTRWPVLLGSMTLATVVFLVAYASAPGRLLIDTILLRVPLLGYILRTSATASFSRVMSLLLASGVTIIESLRTCEELHRNRRLASVIAEARQRVIAGEPLAPGLSARHAFMPMLAGMVGVGERSGEIDRTLLSCAVFHEQRLATLVRVLSSVIEIVVVVVVGIIVGYVYIAFLLALYGAAL